MEIKMIIILIIIVYLIGVVLMHGRDKAIFPNQKASLAVAFISSWVGFFMLCLLSGFRNKPFLQFRAPKTKKKELSNLDFILQMQREGTHGFTKKDTTRIAKFIYRRENNLPLPEIVYDFENKPPRAEIWRD